MVKRSRLYCKLPLCHVRLVQLDPGISHNCSVMMPSKVFGKAIVSLANSIAFEQNLAWVPGLWDTKCHVMVNIPSYYRTQMLTKWVWVLPMPQNHNIDVFDTNPSKWRRDRWTMWTGGSNSPHFLIFILVYCFSYNLYLKGGGTRAEVKSGL